MEPEKENNLPKDYQWAKDSQWIQKYWEQLQIFNEALQTDKKHISDDLVQKYWEQQQSQDFAERPSENSTPDKTRLIDDKQEEEQKELTLTEVANYYQIAQHVHKNDSGMAKVVFGRDKRTMRLYALKTCPNSDSEKLFEREVQFSFELEKHPNIVYSRTVTKHQGKYYIVMELIGPRPHKMDDEVKGDTLADELKYFPNGLEEENALLWAIDFCYGMEHLYSHGITAHKDIKPENLFISQNAELKVGDFGLAVYDGKKRVGTPSYRAPETVSGDYSQQSDIWSFGIVFYQMLYGPLSKHPLYLTPIKEKDCEYKKLNWRKINNSEYSDILNKCLKYDKRERYHNIKELREALMTRWEELGGDVHAHSHDKKKLSAEEYLRKGEGWKTLAEGKMDVPERDKEMECYNRAIKQDSKYVDAYSARGFLRNQLCKYEDAIKDYEVAIRLNSRNPQFYKYRGFAYLKLKKYDKAVKDCNTSIQYFAEDAEVYEYRAQAYHGLHENDSALDDYTQAIDLCRESAPLYERRAFLYNQMEQPKEAVADFEKAIALYLKSNPDSVKKVLIFFPEMWKKANASVQSVLDLFDRSIRQNPAAEKYAQRGRAYFLLKHYEKAITDYSKAIKLAPQNSEYYNNRANAYYNWKHYKEAVADYTTSMELCVSNKEPYWSLPIWFPRLWEQTQTPVQPVLDLLDRSVQQNPTAKEYEKRGRAYLSLKCYKEAEADYTQAIKLNPTVEGYYNQRGNIYYFLGNYKKAVADYTKNARLCIINKEPYWNLTYRFPKLWEQTKTSVQPILNLLSRSVRQNPTAEEYAKRGGAYYKLKRYKEAVADYTKAIELDSQKRWSYYYRRADAYYALEQYKEAIADYTTCIELQISADERFLWLPLQFPKLWEETKTSVQPILDLLERAIQQNPTAEKYAKRGEMYSRLKSYKEAVADFTKAIELDPKNQNYYESRGNAYYDWEHYKEAVADFEKAMTLCVGSSSVRCRFPRLVYFPKAWERAKVSTQHVIDLLNHFVQQDPNANRYNKRGIMYHRLKHYDKAVSDYTKAIKLDSKNAIYYNNRGLAYVDWKHYKKAVADFTKSIELDPKSAILCSNRGHAYYDWGHYEEAVADFTKSIELEPKFATYYNNRGVVYSALECHQKAVADYTQAIELDPNYSSAYSSRGNAWLSLKHYKKALIDCAKAIELDSKNITAYNNHAMVLNGLKYYKKAIVDCNKALELDPKYSYGYKSRGIAYMGLKDYPQAEQDFKKALELDKTNKKALNGLLELYKKTKKPQKAAQIQKRLDKLQKKNDITKRKKNSK